VPDEARRDHGSPTTRPPRLVDAGDAAQDAGMPGPPPAATIDPALVVGIGASAGGLAALTAFFAAVPPRTGLAFIVVTHHPAEEPSHLAEILARRAGVDAVLAADGMRLEAERVYVAPPGVRLTLLHGVMHVLDRERGSSDLPVDAFFRSLATDQTTRAAGVLLSGTGSDGTLGARLIKAEAGVVIAQDPASAEHDGMPASAIRAGVVDWVLPPEAMVERLIAHATLGLAGAVTPSTLASEALQQILVLVRERTGRDFTEYKESTLIRRIERRMKLQRLDAVGYLGFLQEQPVEVDLLFRDLLISVTTFFRDSEVWRVLSERALPDALRRASGVGGFRAWVPGCATGEEAYTVAIAAREVCEQQQIAVPVQIFGTDLDASAIDVARGGTYPSGIAADVGADRVARWFQSDGGQLRLRQDLRDRVVFALHDLLRDPPFTRLDLVSCRNLLIYLKPALQERLMPLFHYALNPGGLLLLGNSETVGPSSEHFEPVDQRSRLFRRREGPSPRRGAPPFAVVRSARSPLGVAMPAAAHPAGPSGGVLSAAAEAALAARYVPPTVVVDERGDVLHVIGRTGAYLELAPGRPTPNAFAMARPGLQLALTSAVREAAARRARVVHRDVEVRGDGLRVDVVAEPLENARVPPGLIMVSFERARGSDAATAPGEAGELRVSELEAELTRSTEDLQRALEELQSSNEELQSANEELQSTNEELETSKEEMQSLNEELRTVNAELQGKLGALSDVNDDMTNLLDSTAIATMFLDRDLRIKRYTQPVTSIVNVIESDVGRPLADLTTTLHYDRLIDDATQVLRTLVVKEAHVTSRLGTHYLVRVLPYRTTHNVIDGVVITFIDTTDLDAVRVLAESHALALHIVESVREPLLVIGQGLRVAIANHSFYRRFRLEAAAVVGVVLGELGGGEWNIPALHAKLEDVLANDAVFEDFEVRADFRGVGPKRLLLNARRLRQPAGQPDLVLCAMEEIAP
jgi:two-component system CheB/CheR fusion protein